MISGENLIGNKLSRESGKSFQAFNQNDLTMLEERFYCATEQEVEEAVRLAAEAYDIYKNYSGKQKAEFLNEIISQMTLVKDKIVERACAETALPEARIQGEFGRTVNQIKMFADLLTEGSWVEASIDNAIPDRQPIPKVDLRRMRQPIGPVVVFGASNFPLAFSTAGGDTASALAAGCPVIVKSHPSHPGTNELVSRAIIEAAKKTNMPEGVFSSLNDDGYDVGSQLVSHSQIKAVGFTGSRKGGQALMNLTNNRPEPIPFFGEMSSINPVFILPEIVKNDSENTASNLAGSITLGVGQFCTNPGLIIAIDDSNLDNLLDKLAEGIRASAPGKMLNKDIADNYNIKRSEILKEKGIKVEGTADAENPLSGPTVISVSGSDFYSNPKLHEEIFGPLSLVVKCADYEEMKSIAGILEGQLTSTIIGTDDEVKNYKDLINIVKEKAGRILFNGVPTGVEVCASMHHGGPFPATSDSKFTSVGTDAIKRFTRPICYQNWPNDLLPEELQRENPLTIWRLVDSKFTKE